MAFGMKTRLIGSGGVSLLPEHKRQFAQPSLDPVRLDDLEVLTVHARRTLVGAALGIGVRQNAASYPSRSRLTVVEPRRRAATR